MENWVWILVLIVAMSGFAVVWYFINLRNQQAVLEPQILEVAASTSTSYSVKAVNFEEIRAATNDFNNQNKLGSGGFGSVYVATLNGSKVAVKRLSQQSSQGDAEFENEMELLAKLHHVNLVQILGYCATEAERLIIYEFMENGSLQDFLSDDVKRTELGWATRVKIITEIARGLEYLHRWSGKHIVHLDIKPANILLDADFSVKIADFGMARSFEARQQETRRAGGTYGYMDPLFVENTDIFDDKTDIYSLGVLVLVLITGRPVLSPSPRNHDVTRHIIREAWLKWNENAYSTLKDFALGETCNDEWFNRMLKLAFLCVQQIPASRPSASYLLSNLEQGGDLLEPTTPRLG